MENIKYITENFSASEDISSIDSYMSIGGFEALRKAVAMDGDALLLYRVV